MQSLEALAAKTSTLMATSRVSMDLIDGGGGLLPRLKPASDRVAHSRSAPALGRSRSESALRYTAGEPVISDALKLPILARKHPESLAGGAQVASGRASSPVDEEHDFDAVAERMHVEKIFRYEKQFTFGLLNFDDEFVAATLHISQDSRTKPALLSQYGIHQLEMRDVHRADILARIEPLGAEEIISRQLMKREIERQRKADLADDGIANETTQPSTEALLLMVELEKAGALEQLGNRGTRIASNPALIRHSDQSRSSARVQPKPVDARHGAALAREADVLKRKMTKPQLAALRKLVGERAFGELLGGGVSGSSAPSTSSFESRIGADSTRLVCTSAPLACGCCGGRGRRRPGERTIGGWTRRTC